MRIQDIQSAEAELSFHWTLLLFFVTAKQRRSLVIKFLEAVEVSDNEAEVRAAFYEKSKGVGNPLIWLMLAKFIFDVLWAWWQTRD